MPKTFRLPGPDRYELNARLKPALFVAMPLFLLPAAWLPEVWTALGGLATLLVGCGVTLLLAQVARQRGRALQARRPNLGHEHSTQVLSHGDPTIDVLTKARYHAFLKAQGLTVLTEDEERLHGAGAHKACITWLLSATRDKNRFALLAEENIAYGYRRNLLALKAVALPLLGAAIVLNSVALWRHWPTIDTRLWIGGAVEAGLIIIALTWVFVIKPQFVADASLAFAERLLACCDELARGEAKKAAKKARG